jgi:hypothetical protein
VRAYLKAGVSTIRARQPPHADTGTHPKTADTNCSQRGTGSILAMILLGNLVLSSYPNNCSNGIKEKTSRFKLS